MNWQPVELDGSLRYEDHSTVFDNDYQFDMVSLNKGLLTQSRPEIHLEFDSTETVNEFGQTGTWWEEFHKFVDGNDKTKIQTAFDCLTKCEKSAIVIGMVGIDMEHGAHVELHPVYAMFINLGPQGPSESGPQGTDRWAFFVRNWGNEGYCGSGDEPIGVLRQMGIPLPETKILRSNMWVYAHGDYSEDQCFAETSVVSPDANGLMVVNLPLPTHKCGVVGDLFIQRNPLISTGGQSTAGGESTTGSSQTSRTSPVVSASSEEGADISPGAMARIAKLDPASRQELYKQLAAIKTERTSKPHKPVPVKITPPSTSRIAEKPPQLTGLKAVPNPALEEKQAKQAQLLDAFLKAHGVQ
jgi:hypothetical protein